jgi:hypothetical protein
VTRVAAESQDASLTAFTDIARSSEASVPETAIVPLQDQPEYSEWIVEVFL